MTTASLKKQDISVQNEFEITEEEKALLVVYIAERFRNYVHIAANRLVEDVLGRIWQRPLQRNDEIRLTFSITQIVADVLEGLGSLRREEKASLKEYDEEIRKLQRAYSQRKRDTISE